MATHNKFMQQEPIHQEFQQLISQELDGELDGAQMERLSQHLDSCGDCRLVQQHMRGIQRIMSTDSVQAPVGLAQRIVAHVDRDGAEVAPIVRSVQWLRRSAVAAAVLVMALASVQLASLPDEVVADTESEAVEAPGLRPDYVRLLSRRPEADQRPLEFLDLFIPQRAKSSD